MTLHVDKKHALKTLLLLFFAQFQKGCSRTFVPGIIRNPARMGRKTVYPRPLLDPRKGFIVVLPRAPQWCDGRPLGGWALVLQRWEFFEVLFFEGRIDAVGVSIELDE